MRSYDDNPLSLSPAYLPCLALTYVDYIWNPTLNYEPDVEQNFRIEDNMYLLLKHPSIVDLQLKLKIDISIKFSTLHQTIHDHDKCWKISETKSITSSPQKPEHQNKSSVVNKAGSKPIIRIKCKEISNKCCTEFCYFLYSIFVY